MAPYNWLYLFLLFNMIMIILTSINYYIPPYLKLTLNNSNKKNYKNYKWKW